MSFVLYASALETVVIFSGTLSDIVTIFYIWLGIEPVTLVLCANLENIQTDCTDRRQSTKQRTSYILKP